MTSFNGTEEKHVCIWENISRIDREKINRYFVKKYYDSLKNFIDKY